MTEYIFYGAFHKENAMRQCAEEHVERSGGKILFYVDDDSTKHGMAGDYAGGVHDISRIKEYPDAIVVVLFYAIGRAVEKLRKNMIFNRVAGLPFLGFRFAFSDREETSLRTEWIRKNAQAVKEIYCDDEYTQALIDEAVRQREMENFAFLEPDIVSRFPYQNYFQDKKIAPEGDITLMDCGAYNGDSILEFFHGFGPALKKVYAYEPDRKSLRELREVLSRIGILDVSECIAAGVSDRSGRLCFESGSGKYNRIADHGADTIRMCRIDDTVKEVTGTLCIKMDVEGFEKAAIKGASETIRKYRPYMAVCIYHKLSDILEIPYMIRSVYKDYKFYIRGGFHSECYAIPSE